MEMTATAALMTALAATNKAVTERVFLCSDGMKLAAQHWTRQLPTASSNAKPRRILCLHGWLDNCRSFYPLAPSLLSRLPDTEIVALDFPGHGLSSHKGPDGPPQVMSELTYYVAEAVSQLEWDSFDLVGHSMGAGISVIYAACFPEQVDRLVLLEGGGPLARNPRDLGKHIRSSIERRLLGNPTLYPQFSNSLQSLSLSSSNGESVSRPRGPRVYPSIDIAVETRCETATLSPGNQYLSKEAALEMVQRATVPAQGTEGVQFRHDPRLQWPSLQYLTDEQVESLYRDIQSPVCLLLAKDGWPFDKARLDRLHQLLQPTVSQTLNGSHHFHADPDTAEDVIQQVAAFLENSTTTVTRTN